MEIKDMKLEDIEQRLAEIAERRSGMAEVLEAEETEETVLDELQTEAEALNQEETELEERKAAILEAAEQRQKELDEVMQNGKTVQEFDKGDLNTMTNAEVRASHEYNVAYANYIKTGDDKECRSLLTENVSGQVPVASYVEGRVRTAWEKEGIISRVRKTFLKGNVRIGFEISADGAYAHTEGTGAVTEESLTLGIVSLVPQSIKKWISISDEVNDLAAEEFLDYIYDELVYRIAKKLADDIILDIEACGTQSVTTLPAVPSMTAATISVSLVDQALSLLSDEATNPCIIMNKQTWGAFKAAQAANNYSYDPFSGLPVVFNDSVSAFSAATTGVTYAIVGDLGLGVQANFPAGESVELKFDDKTLMTSDMIRILGRQFVGHAVVAPKAIAKITK